MPAWSVIFLGVFASITSFPWRLIQFDFVDTEVLLAPLAGATGSQDPHLSVSRMSSRDYGLGETLSSQFRPRVRSPRHQLNV